MMTTTVTTARDVREQGRKLANLLGPSIQATLDALEQRIPAYREDGTVGEYITLLTELGVEVEAIGRALLFHDLAEPATDVDPDAAKILGINTAQAARDAIAARHGPTAPETLEAARSAAAQRLPTSDGIIAAAREAVDKQLGRAG